VAPLVVGAADDRAEREADRVADEVIARLHGEGGEAHVHGAGCGHAGVRRAATSHAGAEVGFEGGELSADLSGRIESRRGSGSPLPGNVRRRLETGFGRSLADVRIHDDAESAALNQAVSARAFTTGRDIFFGAGEFQPDTPEGEHVLAHEAAHVVQQATGAHRTAIRRWDIDAPQIDFTKTRKISTVDSGQPVFFLDDGSAEPLVVKYENREIGLAQIAELMHTSLSNAKSVKHRKVDSGDKQMLDNQIFNDGGLLDPKSFGDAGRELQKSTDVQIWRGVNSVLGIKPDTSPITGLDPVKVTSAYFASTYNVPMFKMMAMSFAGGQTGSKAGKSKDGNQMKPEENRMRALLTDGRHLENLGQMSAVDIFLGNEDRLLQGNLGNWVYDPYSASITAIDHVDSNVSSVFRLDYPDPMFILDKLADGNIGATAKDLVEGVAKGMEDKAGDKTFRQWLDADGGYRRAHIEECFEHGLAAGKKLIVKTFSATRWSVGKSGTQARKLKKTIKAQSRQGARTDNLVDENGEEKTNHYYEVLKTRAAWLKKN
jgi:hypothetical protein